MKHFLAFNLDYHLAIDDEIGSESTFELHGLIDQRYCLLTLHTKPKFLQLVGEASLIR
jgi:hypothetical protein